MFLRILSRPLLLHSSSLYLFLRFLNTILKFWFLIISFIRHLWHMPLFVEATCKWLNSSDEIIVILPRPLPLQIIMFLQKIDKWIFRTEILWWPWAVLETAGPSVCDQQLLVRTSNFVDVSLQIIVEMIKNSDQDWELFQLSSEHCPWGWIF